MILPTEHIKPDRALLGIGAEILGCLDMPMTVSRLWDDFRERRGDSPDAPAITYDWFVLALVLLHTVNAVNFGDGLLRKSAP